MKDNVYYFDKMIPCIDRFLSETADRIYTRAGGVEIGAYVTKEPVPIEERLSYTYAPLAEHEKWGGLFDCALLRLRMTIPERSAGKKVVLRLDVAGEALLYGADGRPLRGLTSKTDSFDVALGSPAKTEYPLTDCAAGGERFEFYADCGCNDLFGRDLGGTIRFAYLAEESTELKALWHDMRFLRALADVVPEKSARRARILYALFDASNTADADDPASVERARAIVRPELDRKGGDASLSVWALGHSHLDLAWLWPVRETKRKAMRTFATALRNLEAYPDYVFCVSQPQQLDWIKTRAPEIFQEIRKRAAEGRIEPVGAMWVEPDLNVTGGESLVRQILYGNKFYTENFGAPVRNAWLPDVFGFTAALPQILKKSGVDALLTIKLSWNRFTRFPHHSFVWKGIDESEVLVHMPPEGTYNSAATPYSVAEAERNYIEKGLSENALLLFGIGDGGGGPGESHLENLSRMKNAEGLPPVTQIKAAEFFERLESERSRLPVYKGEMYLEKHQGTYTTQGRNKRGNRLLENALFTAEFLSVMAGVPYPAAQLETIWKEALLYQFHDILPGSSIRRVYDESVERYEALLGAANAIAQTALNAFGSDRGAYFNPSPFSREEIVYREGRAYRAVCPPLGRGTCQPVTKGAVRADGEEMENGILRVTFDGGAFSVVDLRTGRRTVRKGNVCNVYRDDGDAWDISDNCLLKEHGCFTLAASSTVCDSVRAVRTQTLTYGRSTLTQTITLADGEDRIRVENAIDWQEDGKLLRADFTTDVRADTVECDIQFGRLRRTATENTLAEYAVSEICAQKWVDYVDPDGGVALMNDCKYGYRVKDGCVSISLLRATDYPGENADRGTHAFTYGVYVHGTESEVEKHAYALCRPLLPAPAAMPETFVRVTAPHTVIESVKKCEYDDAVVVRVYENRGVRSRGRLEGAFRKIEETDMTERPGRAVTELEFQPFEIKTLKVYV